MNVKGCRRALRRWCNFLRRATRFALEPLAAGLDLVEFAALHCGVPDEVVWIPIMFAGLAIALVILLLVGWTFHTHPIEAPRFLRDHQRHEILLDFSFWGLSGSVLHLALLLALAVALCLLRCAVSVLTCLATWPRLLLGYVALATGIGWFSPPEVEWPRTPAGPECDR